VMHENPKISAEAGFATPIIVTTAAAVTSVRNTFFLKIHLPSRKPTCTRQCNGFARKIRGLFLIAISHLRRLRVLGAECVVPREETLVSSPPATALRVSGVVRVGCNGVGIRPISPMGKT
jgi:hypothetical protein